jgi:hypothetical protein
MANGSDTLALEIHVNGKVMTNILIPSGDINHEWRMAAVTECLRITGEHPLSTYQILFEKKMPSGLYVFLPDSEVVAGMELRVKLVELEQHSKKGKAKKAKAPDGRAVQLCKELGVCQHTSAWKKNCPPEYEHTYIAFSAANEGCKDCVQRMVQVHNVSLEALSCSKDYNLYSWAEYGLEQHATENPDARDWILNQLAPKYMKPGRGNAGVGRMQLTDGA